MRSTMSNATMNKCWAINHEQKLLESTYANQFKRSENNHELHQQKRSSINPTHHNKAWKNKTEQRSKTTTHTIKNQMKDDPRQSMTIIAQSQTNENSINNPSATRKLKYKTKDECTVDRTNVNQPAAPIPQNKNPNGNQSNSNQYN